MTGRAVYSFVVDAGPTFAYQGWHLAKSLCRRCAAEPGAVHVQFTDAVASDTVAAFAACGYRLHALQRFGDGRWCNKLAQLPNLLPEAFDVAVLLDTDTIAVGDLRPFLRADAVLGKVVDFPNPPLAVLRELYRLAGGRDQPETIRTDAVDTPTLLGNCNGGVYAVPRPLAEGFSAEWRRWASWLFEHGEPLRQAGRMKNVDQVGAALAFLRSGIPFAALPANANYFVHLRAGHGSLDPTRPIALLHYHDALDPAGLLDPRFPLTATEADAVARANDGIRLDHHPSLRSR